ncbi:CpaF family protein [Iodobacter sp. HSC-16F04]|jgi:pilus assembly protein CpaF|uniref:CpaF family protein n=1 Tax=Iodobacter violaceini TaxID=3044271 RepID=A0ABX0KW87_9NEIS|nr:ATPase, T2SS/T4P/T4SS family [Iodobacter violacea]NHQ86737.1 CpaF family protein [Iodobacter violacea]
MTEPLILPVSEQLELISLAKRLLGDQLRSIAPLLEDPDVLEIMINGHNNIFVEKNGRIEKSNLVLPEGSLIAAIKLIAKQNRKEVRENGRISEHLILDAELPGLRIAAALPPISYFGPVMAIRKHGRHVRTLDDYVNDGSFNPFYEDTGEILTARPADHLVSQGGIHLKNSLEWMRDTHQNIVISGATSSGKTTFLNAYLQGLSPYERILTIEDTKELQIKVPNWVALVSNQALGVDTHLLLRLCLRMRPDRIVVGEVRGAEACDLMDALSTGHSGGAVSLHAENAHSALSRLENMMRKSPDMRNTPIEVIREQIAQTINFVVHASRRGGKRAPEEVIEILGCEHGKYITKTLFKKQRIST